jgi:hypothetical protein
VAQVRVAQIRDSAIEDFRSSGPTAEVTPFADAPNAVVRLFPPDEEERRRELLARTARPYARGRHGLGEAHWRHVALAYVDICSTATRRTNTYAELAKRLEISERRARDWVREARRREYLLPGRSGVTEAVPGPRLMPLVTTHSDR